MKFTARATEGNFDFEREKRLKKTNNFCTQTARDRLFFEEFKKIL